MKHVLFEIFYPEALNLEHVFSEAARFEEIVHSGISFTYAENKLCFAGEHGIVHKLEDFVGFCGDMDIDPSLSDYHEHNVQLEKEWEKIAKNKVQEAYEEYMILKKNYKIEHGIKDDLE